MTTRERIQQEFERRGKPFTIVTGTGDPERDARNIADAIVSQLPEPNDPDAVLHAPVESFEFEIRDDPGQYAGAGL